MIFFDASVRLCVPACFEMKLYRPCLNLNASLSQQTVEIIIIQLSELSETHTHTHKYANPAYTHKQTNSPGRALKICKFNEFY